MAWSGDSQDGSSGGIFGQRYDSAGNASGSEFRVNSYTTNSQSSPAVAARGDGRFVVVWASQDQDGSYGGVYGQRSGDDRLFGDGFDAGA